MREKLPINSDRSTNDQRSYRGEDAPNDHRQDAIDVVVWTPLNSGQKVQGPDFHDRWQTICKHEDTNDEDCNDGYTGGDSEKSFHELLKACARVP